MSFRPFQPFRGFGGGSVGSSFDADATDYFARIVTAGSTISDPNKAAINALFVGLKEDGLFTSIKDLGLFAGPDDLTGATVKAIDSLATGTLSLAGSSPYTSANHSKTGGITGKDNAYLTSASNLTSFSQNDFSFGVMVTSTGPASNAGFLSLGADTATTLYCAIAGGNVYTRMRSGSLSALSGNSTGFFGASRSSSTSFTWSSFGNTGTTNTTSSALSSGNTKIFSNYDASAIMSSGAIGAYFTASGIGSSGLASIRNRLTTYLAALT